MLTKLASDKSKCQMCKMKLHHYHMTRLTERERHFDIERKTKSKASSLSIIESVNSLPASEFPSTCPLKFKASGQNEKSAGQRSSLLFIEL